jgi:hypothetical protein
MGWKWRGIRFGEIVPPGKPLPVTLTNVTPGCAEDADVFGESTTLASPYAIRVCSGNSRFFRKYKWRNLFSTVCDPFFQISQTVRMTRRIRRFHQIELIPNPWRSLILKTAVETPRIRQNAGR